MMWPGSESESEHYSEMIESNYRVIAFNGKLENYAPISSQNVTSTFGNSKYKRLKQIYEAMKQKVIIFNMVVNDCSNIAVSRKCKSQNFQVKIINLLSDYDKWKLFTGFVRKTKYSKINFNLILDISLQIYISLLHQNNKSDMYDQRPLKIDEQRPLKINFQHPLKIDDQCPLKIDDQRHLKIDDQCPLNHHRIKLGSGSELPCTYHRIKDGRDSISHLDVNVKSCNKLRMFCSDLKEHKKKIDHFKCVEKTPLNCVDKCEELKNKDLVKCSLNYEQDDLILYKDQSDVSVDLKSSSSKSGTNRTKQWVLVNNKEQCLQEKTKLQMGSFDYIWNDLVHMIYFRVTTQEMQLYMVPGNNMPHPSVVCGMLWHMFKREVNRIITFTKYPISASKSSLMLACQGFLYIGNGGDSDDHVICYFCCRQKNNWQPLDSIDVLHREFSPDCPMVTGIGCENEPLGAARSPQSNISDVNTKNVFSIQAISLFDAPNVMETDSVLEATQPSNGSYREPQRKTNGIQLATQTITRHTRQNSVPVVQSSPVSGTHSSSEGSSISLPSNASYNNLWNISALTTLQDWIFERSISVQPTTSPSVPVQHSTPLSVSVQHSTTPSVSVQPSTPPYVSVEPSETQATAPGETLASGTVSGLRAPVSINPSDQANTTWTTQSSTGDAQGPTYAQLGIITERPKRTEYAPKISRLRTFDSWPRDHRLTPEQLSEAGFYYAGYGDCARCFYCGGGLRNWEDEDDVWVEHARWFPKCAFIRQQMGQVFVDTVKELNQQYTVITYEMVINRTGQPSLYSLNTQESLLKNDAAVKTLVALGYSETDVVFAAKLIKEEFNLVSSDSILERLNKDGRLKVKPPNRLVPSTTSNPNETLEKIRSLKEKNNLLRQQTVCKICMDKEVAVVFLPCGHLISCAECASAMKDCPLCRKPVKGIVRAFIS